VPVFVGPLSATVGQPAGSASPGFGPPGSRLGGGGRFGGGGAFGRLANDAAKTILVHLDAPVTVGVIALAVVLAVAGGLIAGMSGGWRAARLRPAAALAQIQ
jgi:putative ABC transport system permease protein